MSGGPPHHPHNRQVPATNIPNSAWNHLQVPNFFPRQPQLAHMPNEHSILHQPTWHTPTATTTEAAMKMLPHPQVFESLFPRDCVDLSLTTRNGNQNGEPPTPISLSVRDTNKINSLPPGALEIQAVELITKPASPGLKPADLLKSPGTGRNPMPKSLSPGLKLPSSTTTPSDVVKTQQKRSNVRVDSILERLNTMSEKTAPPQGRMEEVRATAEDKAEASHPSEHPVVSVIVQPTGSFDDNSNSSSILNVPTSSTNVRDDDTVSSYSNEDSLDSNKSRRKRKPSKTVRVSKDEAVATTRPPAETEIEPERDPVRIVGQMLEEAKHPEKVESSSELEELIPAKARRKTMSESETIDDIAAMVQEGLKEKQQRQLQREEEEEEEQQPPKPISVSVIKTKEHLAEEVSVGVVAGVQKKATHFVEVENKLEEMFAGIEDVGGDPVKTDPLDLDDAKADEPLLKLDEPVASTSQKVEPPLVTSSTEIKKKSSSSSPRKPKRKAPPRRNSETADSLPQESTPPPTTKKKKLKNAVGKGKARIVDVYAYDSGSNASSTSKSKGPFVQIRGPRDSPLSVSVVNAPTVVDEGGDGERKLPRTKKYHDDSEYRHRVRSKGLHCSTLSNQYDAQTKDASWMCSFCKRGPHASELSGPTSGRETAPPGDLFGPYIITTRCPEFERRLDDPYDKNFRSKKVRRAVDEAAGRKVVRRKPSEGDASTSSSSWDGDVLLGIAETSGGGGTFEVWAHEDCVVWSPGVYLVGPKIVGLEEAVWTSCNVACRRCGLKGANVTCARRGCVDVMHLCCCRSSGWHFVDDDFRAYCPDHRLP